MDSTSDQAMALQDIRVLDLSESIAGQYCCRLLADYGAAVTLVEPPAGSVHATHRAIRERRIDVVLPPE